MNTERHPLRNKSSRKEELAQKVVFMDRDGVICEHIDYPEDWRHSFTAYKDFLHWIPGSKEAIVRLLEANYFVIVVSNQPCVGEGIINICDSGAIMFEMWQDVNRAMGGNFLSDKIYPAGAFRYYTCPHTGKEKYPCVCRKPRPGLVYYAACDWNLSTKDAWMVGDEISDLKAGWMAGIRKLIMVVGKTAPGSGQQEEHGQRWKRNELSGKRVADLSRAVGFILEYDEEGQ